MALNHYVLSFLDVRLKRNVLNEHKELMGTELSKVNIKENSLIVQLQELKSYMITKLDARFKELQSEVLKKVSTLKSVP